MIILGIDPGTATTGFAILKQRSDSLQLIDYGCIRTKAEKPHHERLNEIAKDLTDIINKYKPTTCAIEKLFFSKNIKTAMTVSEARGVLMQQASNAGLDIYEYTPNEVKSTVTGDGKADKLQVQKMVKVILNLREIPKPDDAADAIAIALCHLQKSKLPK
ncbi:crossover junction endodeoxyribonuclease RuvC [Candidatus Peregrinibacteria bacterium]|jgi:crossover junction endodeoxyribonuclease RuvC|nr:crossover junction endodeoxyribonuclease RuvC [Candidatus Peregrinibacteria bacterium]